MNTDDLYRLLRTGHNQAQGIVDTVDVPLLVLDQALCVQAASKAFFEAFQVSRYDTIGQRVYDLGNGQWDIADLRRLLEEVIPKSTAIIDYEVEADFPDIGQRIMLVTARRLQSADSADQTMLLSIVDVTEGHRREAAKDLLFGELRHRMKNLLGVAQSLARRTTTEGRSAEEYRDVFIGRLAALIEAEELAFDEHEPAGLDEIFERVFAPYPEEAVVIEPGAAVELKPRTVKSLCMVFHELTTNAAKYGALSAPGGQVRVAWAVNETTKVLSFDWQESGGPPVTEPSGAGFGTELVQSTVTYSLQGRWEHDYAPGGFRAKIAIPLGSAPDQD